VGIEVWIALFSVGQGQSVEVPSGLLRCVLRSIMKKRHDRTNVAKDLFPIPRLD